ncbi:MAG: argininosuccinate lyase [SAR324 cluster bacterium]|nr:argininosuccinate lyase [SAR324 cluster bacterium]
MTSKKKQVWGSHLSQTPAEQNVMFCAGRDVKSLPMADEVLLPYDIWTNRAHSIMLYQQKIISGDILCSILKGLGELEELVQQGKFVLNPEKEDVHINVESFVTEKYGVAVGGTMHTGRSRNDQVACDMRLYLREACLILEKRLLEFAACLLEHARQHTQTVMPGFTHYQPGMITSWSHWICSYVQGICRDLERVEMTFQQINRNPLGAAAAFGTSWNIDRQKTTQLMGFDRVETNTLDCIVSRWENETQLAQVYAFVMNHLSVISQDLIFLSLPYVGMIQIDEKMVTGSSIMPQKKNPDFAEVIKSKASFVHGGLMGLLGIQKGGLSGYNRDTQLTKYMIMDIIRECELAPAILKSVFETLHVHIKVMKQRSQEGFMNAVDVADYLARTLHLSFRECYNLLALTVKYSQQEGKISHTALQKALRESGYEFDILPDIVASLNDSRFVLNQRMHQGAPAPETILAQIEELSAGLSTHTEFVKTATQQLKQAHDACCAFQPE